MQKGIVMKVYDEYSVVLSNKAYYRIQRKGTMQQGQHILFSEEDIIYYDSERRNSFMQYKKNSSSCSKFINSYHIRSGVRFAKTSIICSG